MKVDIAKSIRLCLDQEYPVFIEGIGSLRKVQISAKFGDKRESILPPSVDIFLEDSTHDNDYLIGLIAEQNKLSKKKAKKYYAEFATRVLNGIINYGKVNLVGIGLISKDADEKLVFKADKQFVSQYYKGLPEVPIKFINRIKKEEKAASASPVDGKTEEKEKSKEGIANKESVAFESLLNKIHEDKKTVSTSGTSSSEKTETTRSQDIQSPVVTPILERDPVPLDMNEYAKQKKTERSSNYLVPVLIALGALLLLFTGIKTCQWIGNNDEPIMTSVEERQSQLEEKEEALNALAENMTGEEGTLIPDECIIITGTFATQSNIDRMVATLEANGYVPYLEEFGPYTRTGIKFACNDLDLESYIRNIRSSIDPKAWYLDPAIHVPYDIN